MEGQEVNLFSYLILRIYVTFDFAGASHADELLYLTSVDTKFTPEDPDWVMVERMVGMITSFAQMGYVLF